MSILPRLDERGAETLTERVRVDCGGPFETPLAGVPDTCAVCSGPRSRGFDTCYRCGQGRRAHGAELADLVVPLTYVVASGSGARHMRLYKTPYPGRSRGLLSRLLRTALHHHGPCLELRLGSRVSAWAVVPSTRSSSPEPHPLLSVARSGGLVGSPVEISCQGVDSDQRSIDVDRFRAGVVPEGRSVLLLEDTWVTGSHAQSAAVALRRSGADHVAIMVMARWLDLDRDDDMDFVRRRVRGDYEPTTCPVGLCTRLGAT